MARNALSGWLTLVLLCALVLGAGPAAAKTPDLALGVWDGSVTQPDGTVEEVTFEVTREQGELGLAMAENGGRVQFSNVRVDEDGDLVFSWRSGEATMGCRLEPGADGGYAGACSDLRLAMSPPQE